MEPTIQIDLLSWALVVSLAANALMFFSWNKIRKLKVKPQETYDVAELLADLLSGPALIRVERIAPSNVLLRSPRSRQ